MARSVDLPEPLIPIKAMRSPWVGLRARNTWTVVKSYKARITSSVTPQISRAVSTPPAPFSNRSLAIILPRNSAAFSTSMAPRRCSASSPIAARAAADSCARSR